MPPRSKILIRNIGVDETGLTIEYMDVPADVRRNGLAATHAIFIPRAEDYDDEIDAVESAALEAVLDALDDFTKLPPVDLVAEVEDAKRTIEEAAEDDEDD